MEVCLAQKSHIPPSWPIVSGFPETYRDISRRADQVPYHSLLNGASIYFFSEEVNACSVPKHNAATWAGSNMEGKPQDVLVRYVAVGGGHPELSQFSQACVPAPFFKVRQNATITVTFENRSLTNTHSIDFQAAIGFSGAASKIFAPPGKSVTVNLTFNNSGMFSYHGAGNLSPLESTENTLMGAYGCIMVIPADTCEGPFMRDLKCSKEFYVGQNDFFLSMCHRRHNSGLHVFDVDKLNKTMVPDYSVFNGRIGSLVDFPITASVLKNTIIYFVNGGNHISSPHMIGSIWSAVYSGNLITPVSTSTGSFSVAALSAVAFVMAPMNTPASNLSAENPWMSPDDPRQLNNYTIVDNALGYVVKGSAGFMYVKDCPVITWPVSCECANLKTYCCGANCTDNFCPCPKPTEVTVPATVKVTPKSIPTVPVAAGVKVTPKSIPTVPVAATVKVTPKSSTTSETKKVGEVWGNKCKK